jgi:hypothetical protein
MSENKVQYPLLAELLAPKISPNTTLSDIARACDLTPAAVSYWFSGHRRPQPPYCAKLAVLLNIHPHLLAEACGYESDVVLKWIPNTVQHLVFLEHAENELPDLRKVRIEGQPRYSARSAARLSTSLQSIERLCSGASLKKLKILQARIIYEHGMGIEEYLPMQEIVDKITPLANMIRATAYDYDDRELFGFGKFLEGNAYYIASHHRKSITFLEDALASIEEDVDTKLLVLRTKAVASGYIGDERGFRNAEREARKLIEKGKFLHLETACSVIEGFGRARGILAVREPNNQKKLRLFDEALRILEEGDDYLPKMLANNEHVPARMIQLERSRFEVFCNQPSKDIQAITNIGEKGKTMAKQHGYVRLVQFFDQLFKRVLD